MDETKREFIMFFFVSADHSVIVGIICPATHACALQLGECSSILSRTSALLGQPAVSLSLPSRRNPRNIMVYR